MSLIPALPGPPTAHHGPPTVDRSPWTRVLYGPLGLLALAVSVFLLAFVAVALAPADNRVAAWWPAAGLSVLAFAWAPRGRRLAVFVTIVAASGVANGVAGRNAAMSLGFGLSNAAEAVVVAWWLLRGRVRPRLATLDDVARLFTATVLGTTVMGLGAGLTVLIGQGGDLPTTARTVMASHAAAILVMAPLGMRARAPRAPGRGVEALAQWAAVLGVTLTVFWPGQTLPISYVTIPFLVWGALRLGTRTMAGQLLVVATLASALSR
ncbi:MAG: uncharacterized protein JWP95_1353, partial [Actinotalea sp.]|nr:uncharacterized protein [Actinotalea sp.]